MSEATAALMGDNGGAGDAGAANGAGDAGGQQVNWTDGLSEDFQGLVQNKGWSGVQDVLTSYANLEKFAGGAKNLLEMPGDDATPEMMDAFYAKLGRPGSPEEYSFQAPDDADAELDTWFRQAAHKHGLSDSQAASLYNEWNEMSAGRLEQIMTSQAENSERAIADLKKEWGQGFDTQIDSGKRAVAALGYNEESLQGLEEKLGTADMLKLFATIGSKMGEDTFEGGPRSDNSGFGITPAAAKQQIAELKGDKAFMDRYLTGDKAAVAKYQRLMEAAYAG